MKSLLEKLGYTINKTSNVWSHQNYRGIDYSDGEAVENQIAQIIASAKDISVLSTELHDQCADWPTRYHLSANRANILRPLESFIGGNVLEIGAGCGAITRYLGELGVQVLALEGSPRRAAIARSRARDLENVHVLAENFNEFQSEEKFDVVTLIGVLEYANLFTTGETPANSMLQRVRALLKPNGKLIVAIENQLGLKYFAGAIEDHVGIPMYGVEGKYTKNCPQTFGRATLESIFTEAGFISSEFLSPLPDYKLPSSIITKAGFNNQQFDSAALAWQSACRDHQLPQYPNFSLENTWPEIVKNGLGMELANSFLIIASPTEQALLEAEVLAYHYSTGRRPNFCKETQFVVSEDSDIHVRYKPLTYPWSASQENNFVKFNIPQKAKYSTGKALSLDFINIVTRDGWSINDIGNFLTKYISILERELHTKIWINGEINPEQELPGRFFDVVPQNIIVDENNGNYSVIDTEWELTRPISIGYLLFRSIMTVSLSLTVYGKPAKASTLTIRSLIAESLYAAGLRIIDSQLTSYIQLEAEVQAAVTGLKNVNFSSWQEHQIATTKSWQIPSSFECQINELTNRAQQLNLEIQQLNDSIQQKNTQSTATIESLQHDLEALKRSKSWQVTSPLRFLTRFARYGITDNDRQRLFETLRYCYHSLPLSTSTRSRIKSIYQNIWQPVVKKVQNSAYPPTPFFAPVTPPESQAMGKADYVVWGVIDWHFRIQRPQQLAIALAKQGHRVFYISPSLIDDDRAGFEIDYLDSSERLFQVRLFSAGAPSIYTAAPDSKTVTQLRHSIGELLIWASSNTSISLVDHPYWLEIASALPSNRLIYDCMDHHEGFGNNGASLIALEEQLLKRAEFTITTSAWLDECVAAKTPRRALIRNAVAYDHFAMAPTKIYRDLENRKIIGYYGAIAEWFDLELVEEVAKQNSNCVVLLVGADTINAKAALGRIKNIIFTGEVPYTELPYYLHGFNVCLLPFKVIPLTLATNPVKAYEYLAAGKPIVAVDLPEMQQFHDLVFVENEKKSFAQRVQKVINTLEDDGLIKARKNFAKNQTWEHRASELCKHLKNIEADSPLISVIVVTYNNLDLTKACLSSIDNYSDYPNLEILVIDNASSDDSPAYLSQWVRKGPNRKLVLNDENLGFAAANNQGLNLARGEFLVLLNNDTHVTPGWLRTLAAHLQRDPSIGLIGPVTNNIGNESKIEITYSNMQEMLNLSADYTKRHIDELYPLQTAAFFCVMMPRSTYQEVGPLDEEFGKGFFEDDDYCRRIEQLNKRVVCAEDVFIHHHLSASFNKLRSKERQELFDQNKAYYEKKWGTWKPHRYRD